MLTAKVNEIVRLYPLGALAKTKCIHLQKLTDSKSKYKKVLRTHKHILAETQQPKQRLLLLFIPHSQTKATNNKQSIKYHEPPHQRDIVNAFKVTVVN